MNCRNKKFKSINTTTHPEMENIPPKEIFINFELPQNVDMQDVEVTLTQGMEGEITENIIKKTGSHYEITGQCSLPIQISSKTKIIASPYKSKEFVSIFERKMSTNKNCSTIAKLYSARLELNTAIIDIFQSSIKSIEEGTISEPNMYSISHRQYTIIRKACKLLKRVADYNIINWNSCKSILTTVMKNMNFQSCKDITVDQSFIDAITRIYEIFGTLIEKSTYSTENPVNLDSMKNICSNASCSSSKESSFNSTKNYICSTKSSSITKNNSSNKIVTIQDAKMHLLESLLKVEAVKKYLECNNVEELNFNEDDLWSEFSESILSKSRDTPFKLNAQLNGTPIVVQVATENEIRKMSDNVSLQNRTADHLSEKENIEMFFRSKCEDQVNIQDDSLQVLEREATIKKEVDAVSKDDKNINTDITFHPPNISEFSLYSMQSKSSSCLELDIFTKAMKNAMSHKDCNKSTETEINTQNRSSNTDDSSCMQKKNQYSCANIKPSTKEQCSEIVPIAKNAAVNTEEITTNSKRDQFTETDSVCRSEAKLTSTLSLQKLFQADKITETLPIPENQQGASRVIINGDPQNSRPCCSGTTTARCLSIHPIGKPIFPKSSISRLPRYQYQKMSRSSSIDTHVSWRSSCSAKVKEEGDEETESKKPQSSETVTVLCSNKTKKQSSPKKSIQDKSSEDQKTSFSKNTVKGKIKKSPIIIEKDDSVRERTQCDVDYELNKILQSAGPLTVLSQYKGNDGFMYLTIKLTTKLACEDNKDLNELMLNIPETNTTQFLAKEILQRGSTVKLNVPPSNSANVQCSNERNDSSNEKKVTLKSTEENHNKEIEVSSQSKMKDNTTNTENNMSQCEGLQNDLNAKQLDSDHKFCKTRNCPRNRNFTNFRCSIGHQINKHLLDGLLEKNFVRKKCTETSLRRSQLKIKKSKSSPELMHREGDRIQLDELDRKLHHYKREIRDLVKSKKGCRHLLQSLISLISKLHNAHNENKCKTADKMAETMSKFILMKKDDIRMEKHTEGAKATKLSNKQMCYCVQGARTLKSQRLVKKETENALGNVSRSNEESKQTMPESNCERSGLHSPEDKKRANHKRSAIATKEAENTPNYEAARKQKEQYLRQIAQTIQAAKKICESNTKGSYDSKNSQSTLKSVHLDENDLQAIKANIGEYLLNKCSKIGSQIQTNFQVNYCTEIVSSIAFDFNRYIKLETFPYVVPKYYDVRVVSYQREGDDNKPGTAVSSGNQTEMEMPKVIPPRNRSSMPKSKYYSYPEDVVEDDEAQRTERVVRVHKTPPASRGISETDMPFEYNIETDVDAVPYQPSEISLPVEPDDEEFVQPEATSTPVPSKEDIPPAIVPVRKKRCACQPKKSHHDFSRVCKTEGPDNRCVCRKKSKTGCVCESKEANEEEIKKCKSIATETKRCSGKDGELLKEMNREPSKEHVATAGVYARSSPRTKERGSDDGARTRSSSRGKPTRDAKDDDEVGRSRDGGPCSGKKSSSREKSRRRARDDGAYQEERDRDGGYYGTGAPQNASRRQRRAAIDEEELGRGRGMAQNAGGRKVWQNTYQRQDATYHDMKCLCGTKEIEKSICPELVEKMISTWNEKEKEQNRAAFICWALTRVYRNKDGTKRVQVVDVSTNPPGHFYVDSDNKLHVLSETPKKDGGKSSSRQTRSYGDETGKEYAEPTRCQCVSGGEADASTRQGDARAAGGEDPADKGDRDRTIICWAMTRIVLSANGAKDIEIVEVSGNPPGHFYVDSQNKLHVLSEDQARAYNARSKPR